MATTRYKTIREYVHALLRKVDYVEDGREFGYSYARIRNAVLKKYPRVETPGPHTGHETQMPIKALYEIALQLNQRSDTRLPFRPRSKHQTKIKTNKRA